MRGLDNTNPLRDAAGIDLWERSERGGDELQNGVDGKAGQHVPVDAHGPPSLRPSKTDEMLDIDYKVELPFAMLKGEADLVIRCLFAAFHANDREFLREMPATTFTEIIRVLEPRHFMSPLAAAHLELSAAMAEQLGVAPMREVAYEYASVLKEVVSIRRGIRLTLSDFKALLRSARDLGHKKFAIMLWDLLLAEGYTPDTKCYNLYMSAAVWNGVHSAGGRKRIRVIPFNISSRQKEHPKNYFRSFRVGAGGVKEATTTIFNEMHADGAVPDEETFRILITAASREGDIATVKSILKKVWNIDVDAVVAGEDESTIIPKSLPTYSPLHPTSELLFVLAQAFGTNNDIPTALRLVDFVARYYNFPITQDVWSQLFEWTFVLSLPRTGTDRKTGANAGKLPQDSVLKLWNTMTSEPYSIQPTIRMYNLLIKNLFRRGMSSEIAQKMREGRGLYFLHQRQTNHAWDKLQFKLRQEYPSSEKVEKLRHEFEAADLVRKRDLIWLTRWVRLWLGSFRRSHREAYKEQRTARELPGLLWEWRRHAPTIVKYETPTGFVNFRIRGEGDIKRFAEERLEHRTGLREVMRGAERYVGERWVEGEVRVANRLREER